MATFDDNPDILSGKRVFADVGLPLKASFGDQISLLIVTELLKYNMHVLTVIIYFFWLCIFLHPITRWKNLEKL